jgi:hypothetical protein
VTEPPFRFGFARRAGAPGALALGLALWALAAALREPPKAWGDAPEYLLMAESLAAHASPDLREEDVRAVARQFLAFGVEFPPGGKLIGYYKARDGRRYSYHFWAYSALTLPARAALAPFRVSPLKAPQVTNALLLGAALLALALALPAAPPVRALAAALLFFSPAGWFVSWAHPEVMSTALLVLALVASTRGRHAWAVGLAAGAALQNPQLMLAAGALWAIGLLSAPAAERLGTAFRLALPGATFAAHPLFYLWKFGTPSVVAHEATSLAKISVARALGLLFDLSLGLLPYVPLLLLLGLGLWARALWRRGPARELLLAAAFFAILLVNTLQWNYNHGSSGPSRYVIWMLPLLLSAAISGVPSRARLAALALAVVLQAGVFFSRGAFAAPYDSLHHSPVAGFVLERWPALYDPDYEVFIKRTLHTEGSTRGPYVYKAGDGGCRKVLASRVMEAQVREACGALPAGAESFFRTPSPQPDRDWRYLDY